MFFLVEFIEEGSLYVVGQEDVFSDCYDIDTIVEVIFNAKQCRAKILAFSYSKPDLVENMKVLLRERVTKRVSIAAKTVFPSPSEIGVRPSNKRKLDESTAFGEEAYFGGGFHESSERASPSKIVPLSNQIPLPSVHPSFCESSLSSRSSSKFSPGPSDDEFRIEVLSQLAILREEVKLLKEKQCCCLRQEFLRDASFEFSSISNVEDLNLVMLSMTPEKERKMALWLSTAGGGTLTQSCRQVVNMLLSHEMQLTCNKSGKHGKHDISKLFPPMITAIKKIVACSAYDAEIGISRFLAGAGDRCGGRQRRFKKPLKREPKEGEPCSSSLPVIRSC